MCKHLWAAFSLNPGLPGDSSLPVNSQVRRGLNILTAQFPAVNQDPISIIVQTPDRSPILAPQNYRGALHHELNGSPANHM